MTVLEFFASVIDSLAWPALVGFIVYLARDQVVQLVGRLSRFKYKEIEAEFRQALEDIEVIRGEAIEGEIVEVKQEGTITLDELADVSPRAAIMEAWIKIEMATRDFYESIGLERRLSYRGLREVPNEHQRQIEPVMGAYKELRQLRNKAAHSSDFDLSADIAREYIAVASQVETALRKAAG